MSNWLKGEGDARVYLAGVLVNEAYNAQEKAFLLSLALKKTDDGGLKNVKVGTTVDGVVAPTITCFHSTIPKTNFAAFYRRLNIHDIILIGSGSHIGGDNKKYKVQWAHGAKLKIDLDQVDKTGAGGDLLPDPKRLGATGNPRKPAK